jgi:hypothetical protein
MRYLAAAIAIFTYLQAAAVDHRATNSVANIVALGKWSVAQASDASKPMIIRFRDGFETFPDISAYSRRLTVTWQIAPNSGGLRDQSVQLGRIKAIPHGRGADTIKIDSADDAKWQFFYKDVLGSIGK